MLRPFDIPVQGFLALAILDPQPEPGAGDDPDELWVHELIGAQVRDQHGGDLGRVASVEDNPAADLLVLESGALIPMTFVVDAADGCVTVDIPEGLLDL